MQVKLKELYNTRYFYVSFVHDLQYLFRTCRRLRDGEDFKYNTPTELHREVYDAAKSKQPVIFDVADCRLGPGCAQEICNEQRLGTRFVDSIDPYRNKILQDNVMRLTPRGVPRTELPALLPEANIKEYISSLQSGVCYTVPSSALDIAKYLIILIQMTRPKSVDIDISPVLADMFHLVATNLSTSALQKYSEFYFQNGELGPIHMMFEDGKTVLPGVGTVTISDASNYGELIPTAFGSERLLLDTDWTGLKELCLAAVNNFVTKKSYSLQEVL